MSLQQQRWIAAYLFILPICTIFLIFRVWPMVKSVQLSLVQWDIIRKAKFVGLANYQHLFADKDFLHSFVNTFRFVVGIVPIRLIVALFFAILFDFHLQAKELWKAIYYLPVVTPGIAAAQVWKWLYEPRVGLINALLNFFGLPRQGWLLDVNLALYSVIIYTIWAGLGYDLIVILAGLQGIPSVYYEAAKIDGADALRVFWHITIPLLFPTLFFLFVMGVIGTMQIFGSIWVMTAGGPVGATTVVVLHIYREAFSYYKLGYASAMAMVLFVVILILTLVQFRLLGRRAEFSL